MIVFDLRCSGGHVFEAWFASSGAYARQVEGGLLTCPVCGDSDVGKAVMAPNVATKGNRTTAVAVCPPPTSPAEAAKAMLAAIAGAQAKALEGSTWVGADFAATARAMHEGSAESLPIHGQATAAEARELVEDGVPVAPLLVPIIPPALRN